MTAMITPVIERRAATAKPSYRVPSMQEIAALPKNGLNVVSTFSGCGGSCLGFEMAGYTIRFASEFIPAAAETYRLNHPRVPIDTGDIRALDAQTILETIGMQRGEVDVLEGSPPCASFSTAGAVDSNWQQVKQYSDTQQRTDDLFFEFVRILDGIQPKVFVAENVAGLVKGTAKGYFLQILAAMKASRYRVGCQLLDAQYLGIPQRRLRTIFIGVRDDLGIEPAFPKPLAYRYSVRDALPSIIHDQSVECQDGAFPRTYISANRPSPTIVASRATQLLIRNTANARSDQTGIERRRIEIADLKRLCSFPDDFVLTGGFGRQWERLGRAVPPLMMRAVAETLRDQVFAKL
jgi:DNA (cytosine-5)-methyltransferase 1